MALRVFRSVMAIVAALTLTGSVVTASSPARQAAVSAPSAAHGCGHHEDAAVTEAAMPPKANKGKAHEPHGNPHGQQPADEPEEAPADHERKQNHGWFVSQGAHDQSTTGREHGAAVSEVARGNSGKPESAEHQP